MTSIGVNDSLASVSHGMDESVNCCPGNVAPSLEDGLLQLCGCCWSGTDLVELPLEMIPKMFNWVHIWAEHWPGHGVDVVMLKEILGEPGCMCTCIVLLEDKVSMSLKKGHNVRAKDLVYVALCCHAIPVTRTKAAGEHWPQELVEANAAPKHHAWPSPGVVLHDAVISKTFASSPPHSDTPVHMAHAVAALDSKQNGQPLPPVPVGMVSGPLQACKTMSTSKDWNSSWTTVLQVPLRQLSLHHLAADRSLVIPQGVPASLVGCLEPVPYVMAEDMAVLPLCCHPRSSSSWSVVSGSSGREVLLKAVDGHQVHIKSNCHSSGSFPAVSRPTALSHSAGVSLGMVSVSKMGPAATVQGSSFIASESENTSHASVVCCCACTCCEQASGVP